MKKRIFCYLISLSLIVALFIQTVTAQIDEAEQAISRHKNRGYGTLTKGYAKEDRAAGVLDRGQLADVISNFGIISNYHLFAPALHWPSYGDETQQYCFGFNLLVGVKGDVIASIHDPASAAENFDWEALDGSLGRLYSGEVKLSDGTPVLATSDIPQTWPQGYFDSTGTWISTPNQRHWPGNFRIDPQTGKEVPGQFVSERDIYCVFDDANNLNGPYGIRVEQTSYSFSRTYAEDFLIFDFNITNTSSQDLDSVYVGFIADFKVDFDRHDMIRFVRSNPKIPPNKKDLVYLYDSNNTPYGNWDQVGYIGLVSLYTPGNLGITDFHYFDNEYEPATNEQLWAIMSSDTTEKVHIDPRYYFHGDNYRVDDDSLAPYLDPEGNAQGTDFVFIISSGPFTFSAGETVRTTVAVAMGTDEADLLANVEMIHNMAANYFLGPSPPQAPRVYAVPGDRKVTVTWDARTSETSRDLLTGLIDFEGYKVYRSEDWGKTWGQPITDEKGKTVGYMPLAQFDLDNDISGKDPYSYFYLGDNTGLKHTFVDSTVINGREYWYAVTAYDQGNPGTGLPSYESARGVTTDEPNLVSVVPGVSASGRQGGIVIQGDTLTAQGGTCASTLAIQVIAPDSLKDADYKITFNDVGMMITRGDTAIDTTYTTTFNLINLTTGDTLLKNHPLLDESGDNVPVTEGFRVLAKNARPEVIFEDWTLVQGDTCTFEWRTSPFERWATHPWVAPATIYTWDDFRITADYTPDGGLWAHWYDAFYGVDQDTTLHLPIKVEVVTDPENPIDVSDQTWLIEYQIPDDPSMRLMFFSPLGWDLEPGGKGYNASASYPGLWPDILNLERVLIDPLTGAKRYTGLYLFTQNYPTDYVDQWGNSVHRPAVKPTQGDQFTIRTRKLFRSSIWYEFSTQKTTYTTEGVSLDNIKVVPNPYIVRAGWEANAYQGRIQFNHLPAKCDITIYTVAGDKVITLYHDDLSGTEYWNLRNEADVNVAYGLYVYVVKTPAGDKKIGKFLIIK